MKSARYGSPVEWHQDWAFYPHTNDDILAIGVLLDDTSEANGPLLCTPGTHLGPVWSHHGSDGRFCGSIDPAEIEGEIARPVPLTGRAGSVSFHPAPTLHSSAEKCSPRARASRLGAECLRPAAQPAALRSGSCGCLTVDGGEGLRRVRQSPPHRPG